MFPQITGMFHCGTCSGWRWWWSGAEVCLILLLSVAVWSGDAAPAPLASGTFGLGEGGLVCVLLGMHLLVHEVTCQFISAFDFQLGDRKVYT